MPTYCAISLAARMLTLPNWGQLVTSAAQETGMSQISQSRAAHNSMYSVNCRFRRPRAQLPHYPETR